MNIGEFIFGFFAPWHGFRHLLSDSRLRALAVVPLLVSVVVGSMLTVFGIYGLGLAISSVSVELGTMLALDPAGFGRVVVTLLLWPVGLLILGVGIYMSVRLIAAPFYSYLAEKTLVKLGVRVDRPFVLHEWLWTAMRMLVVSLVKSFLFACASVILLVFSLVPILNVMAAIGFAFMLAFDISDYSFEAMEWPLRRRLQHVRTHLATYAGLACAMSLAMVVPGLNIILLPSAVVGAGEIFHRTQGTGER